MIDKLAAIQERYHYLEEQLSDPDVLSDMKRYKKIGKEYKDLKPIIDAFLAYQVLHGNVQTAQEMLKENDAEMKEMAQMELNELFPKKKR